MMKIYYGLVLLTIVILITMVLLPYLFDYKIFWRSRTNTQDYKTNKEDLKVKEQQLEKELESRKEELNREAEEFENLKKE